LVSFLASRGDADLPPISPNPTDIIRIEPTLISPQKTDPQPTGYTPPTNTQKPRNTATLTIKASTNSPLSDPESCPGAAPQRVEIGDRVRVCTSEDRLILRDDPSATGNEIYRMYPGVKMTIIGGPTCGSSTTWWQVRVDKGSWVWDNHEFATTMETKGWVREGGYEGDLYYICPDK